jgi:LPS O-antigen subunit length determinant protein (WzzB/FepE family)
LYVRTRYGSIQIDVLDRDAKLAADMANKIVDLIDTVKNNMVAERTWPAYEINKRKKEQLEKEREELVHRLDTLSAMGVMSLDGRTELFQALVNAGGADKADIKKIIDVNIKYGSTFDALDFSLKEKITQLELFKVSYEQAESDAYAIFNHKFVVERAVVADKKDKPKRLIIVLLATIGAFVFTLFTLLISDRLNELKKIS